jgi:predicted PurR-regulated permease PerM
MKGRVRMPEAHLLVFVLVMAAALGVVGVFLSPPLFAVLHYLYIQAYIPWVERRPPAK